MFVIASHAASAGATFLHCALCVAFILAVVAGMGIGAMAQARGTNAPLDNGAEV